MNYAECALGARGHMGPHCKACTVCDGRGCKGAIPGPGAKGSGTVAVANHAAWQGLYVNMDTFHEPFEADTTLSFFGRELKAPIMVAPVGDVQRHYGTELTMDAYNDEVTAGAAEAGTIAWTGDGVDPGIYRHACEDLKALGGAGVAVCKPWSQDVVDEKLALALDAGVTAVAMDVDSAGLPFLKGVVPPAGPKSESALAEIISSCPVPFIVKGVMTPDAAEKAVRAGASGIVVSNHGGRVLDGTPPTASALPAIAASVPDDVCVLVDGGIRSGLDVFRALALGADAALICRPFVVAVYGGGASGVKGYFDQLVAELKDVMEMCGAKTIADIERGMLYEGFRR